MNFFTNWKDKVTQYVDVRLQLIKLGLIERTSNVLGSMIIAFIFVMLGAGALSFIGWGVMETFSTWFNSRIAGAFAAAGFYLFLIWIIYLMRRTLIKSFSAIFIRIMTEGDEEEEAEKEAQRRANDNESKTMS